MTVSSRWNNFPPGRPTWRQARRGLFCTLLAILTAHLGACEAGGDEQSWDLGSSPETAIDASRETGDEPSNTNEVDTGSRTVDTEDAVDLREETGGPIYCGRSDRIITTIGAAEQLGECDIYRGSFHFTDDSLSVSNLERLPDLREIRGGLKVMDTQSLESLAGLERLEWLGSFRFRSCSNIESLAALSSLEYVEGPFRMSFTEVPTFRGLENLQSTGALEVRSNLYLRNFDRLEGFERVRGDVEIASHSEISTREAREFIDRLEVEGEVEIREK